MERMWLERSRGYGSGLLRRAPRRQGIRVFYYHGVTERKTDPHLERNLILLTQFRQQIRYLKRFQVLSLSRLAAQLSDDTLPRRPAAAITFDDGYANNLLAAELLAEAGLPWCLFVTTSAVGDGGCLWTVELSLLLLHGQAPAIEFLEGSWPLRTRQDRLLAFQEIRVLLKKLPAAARLQAMSHLRPQFPGGELQRLLHQFPSLRMLGWDEVRQLGHSGVEIGSHGVRHEIHHAEQPAGVRQRELTDSRNELQSRLDLPCRFYAFPNGDTAADSAVEVRHAGYELGFTTRPDTVTPHSDPFALPRLPVRTPLRNFVRQFWWQAPAPG